MFDATRFTREMRKAQFIHWTRDWLFFICVLLMFLVLLASSSVRQYPAVPFGGGGGGAFADHGVIGDPVAGGIIAYLTERALNYVMDNWNYTYTSCTGSDCNMPGVSGPMGGGGGTGF